MIRYVTAVCLHANADHLKPGDVFYPAYGTLGEFSVVCEQFRCLDCGAWLPLGPSNDADPNVAIEIRAAEIADELSEADRLCDWTFGRVDNDEERRGWSIAETNIQNHTDSWQAGYLARCIVTHDAAREGDER